MTSISSAHCQAPSPSLLWIVHPGDITSSLTPLHGWNVRAGVPYPAHPQSHSLAISWTGRVFSCTEPITSFNPQLSKAGRGPWMPVLAPAPAACQIPGARRQKPTSGLTKASAHSHCSKHTSSAAEGETQSAPEPCLTSVRRAAKLHTENIQPLHFPER